MKFENQEAQLLQPMGDKISNLAGDLLSSNLDFKALSSAALSSIKIPEQFGQLELVLDSVSGISIGELELKDTGNGAPYCGSDGGIPQDRPTNGSKGAEKDRPGGTAPLESGFAASVARVIQEPDGRCYLDEDRDGHPDDRRAPEGLGSEDTVPCQRS
ncbi:MAG: hypothetical protein HY986_25655 [Candidatus Melainabacteria bacterium]|nr:hypothetical protein [Candidatus Melainabacteria bacterium]